MQEHPIIFNTEMVKAILDGRKTMTRRVIKPQPLSINDDFDGTWEWKEKGHYYDDLTMAYTLREQCPYGQVGDRLWVRETCYLRADFSWRDYPEKAKHYTLYKADNPNIEQAWHPYIETTPSIHMPRCVSRIDKIIAELRAERLLDITLADAIREGFNSIEEFLDFWDMLNGKRGYGREVNPWNWVIGW